MAVWLFHASPSPAQSADSVYTDRATSQTEVQLPRPLAAAATLPAEAVGDSHVVLLIHLGAMGDVIDAKVTSGNEPFASIALEASKQFRFEPARRNGRPIECRFLFEVVWQRAVEADVRSTGAEPDRVALAKAPGVTNAVPSSSAQQVSESARSTGPSKHSVNGASLQNTDRDLEVLVQGMRVAPGAQTLTAAEARETPGTFGDPLRAVEVLPGITPVISGLPYFYVRGAPPGNVGYFVDGVRVPMLWHALVGPSVLHPSTLEKVTLYRGAYPAQYGRYAGAVVTADTAPPASERRGEAGIRLIDVSAMAKAPLGSVGRGIPESTFSLSGRYSYAGPALSLLSDKVDLGYWDYQSMANVPISRNSSIGFLGMGAFDHLKTSEVNSSTQYHRADLRFDHRFGRSGGLRFAVTLGHDDTSGKQGNVRDNLAGARVQIEHRLNEKIIGRAGADLYLDSYRLSLEDSVRYQTAVTLGALLPTRRETTAGAYAAIDYFPTSRIQVTEGVRADLYSTGGQTKVAVDPRVSARVLLSKRLTAEHAVGWAHQASAVVPGVPAAQLMSLRGGLQSSIQASSGVNYQLDDYTQTSIQVFANNYQSLADPLGTTHRLTFTVDNAGERVRGAAYGAEFYLRRQLHERIGGFLSYTISRSTRSHESIATLSSLDRTHVLNAAVAIDAGRRWRLGVRASMLSGLPTRWATTAGDVYRGGERTAPYFRLDLRVEKRWVWSDRYWISWVAELMNATFAQEISERSCNEVRCSEVRTGPIVLPSVGAEVHF